jgi:hypothetical protein
MHRCTVTLGSEQCLFPLPFSSMFFVLAIHSEILKTSDIIVWPPDVLTNASGDFDAILYHVSLNA